ncbi:hypothetical protein LJB85_00515 [Porphyromonadaceae bacterium OttesenSCG-928-L07]|nr:hypothetical protein [Porphyromonadaceae bacterium OttesenSCG-928-L07]
MKYKIIFLIFLIAMCWQCSVHKQQTSELIPLKEATGTEAIINGWNKMPFYNNFDFSQERSFLINSLYENIAKADTIIFIESFDDQRQYYYSTSIYNSWDKSLECYYVESDINTSSFYLKSTSEKSMLFERRIVSAVQQGGIAVFAERYNVQVTTKIRYCSITVLIKKGEQYTAQFYKTQYHLIIPEFQPMNDRKEEPWMDLDY